jgi:hypothetical protein
MRSGMNSQPRPASGAEAARSALVSPAGAVETPAERVARIAGVLWSTPLAADVEPWTTPGRVTASAPQDEGRGQ